MAGRWKNTDAGLLVEAAPGAWLALPIQPKGENDFKVTFTRQRGQHSIALIIPMGESQASFEVDAWGERLAGLQNLTGRTIKENSTRKANMVLKNGQRYTMTVEVRRGVVRGLLDGQVIATYRGNGSDPALLDLWAMPGKANLAIGAWDSESVFHNGERAIRTAGLNWRRPLSTSCNLTACGRNCGSFPVRGPPISNFSPWREASIIRMEESLVSLGWLQGKPIVAVPPNAEFRRYTPRPPW